MVTLQTIPANPKFQDLTGQTFAGWKVVGYAGRPTGSTKWLCRCTCEKRTERAIAASNLKNMIDNGECGCSRAANKVRNFSHRLSKRPVYQLWVKMIARCRNPKQHGFKHYGGRGIDACEGFSVFTKFESIMGERPQGMTLDRINNGQGYHCGRCAECAYRGWPLNCRWADDFQQARNRRNNRVLVVDGESAPVSVWAEKFGVSHGVIHARLKAGWLSDDAVKTPATDLSPTLVEHCGQMTPIVDLARAAGISASAFKSRLKFGWSVEKIMTTPIRKR